MKLSQLSADQLSSLGSEQVDRIVFAEKEDQLDKGLAAILLGGSPLVMAERARAAAELYHQNAVTYIIPTGGVRWDTDRGRMSERSICRRCCWRQECRKARSFWKTKRQPPERICSVPLC